MDDSYKKSKAIEKGTLGALAAAIGATIESICYAKWPELASALTAGAISGPVAGAILVAINAAKYYASKYVGA